MKCLSTILTCLLLTAAFTCHAQEMTREWLYSTLEKGCVSFDYDYSSDSKVPLTGKGRVTVQGKMYRTEGNGLKIWCDSTTRWTLDPQAHEAYIENVSDSPDILSNPIPYLNALSGVRNAGGVISGTYDADGTRILFNIRNISVAEKTESPDSFRFDRNSLGREWVVTDLR